jgi:hypothetical protein
MVWVYQIIIDDQLPVMTWDFKFFEEKIYYFGS